MKKIVIYAVALISCSTAGSLITFLTTYLIVLSRADIRIATPMAERYFLLAEELMVPGGVLGAAFGLAVISLKRVQ